MLKEHEESIAQKNQEMFHKQEHDPKQNLEFSQMNMTKKIENLGNLRFEEIKEYENESCEDWENKVYDLLVKKTQTGH